jgi:phosphoglucomutase
MKQYREHPLTEIAGSKVAAIYDYASLKGYDFIEGEDLTINMPTTSNVLQYFTEDGTKVSIRPSGTEPKIKFYFEVHSKIKTVADISHAEQAALAKIDRIKESLGI